MSEVNVTSRAEEACLSDLEVSGGSTTGSFDVWRDQTDHSMGPSR